MANVSLITNPILPPIPDEPKDLENDNLQKAFDSLWKWMKDLSLQLKVLLGSSQALNTAITIPLVQAGTVLPFAGPSANIPSGYLLCDGSQVSQAQYPSLFSAIGTSWNTGGEAAGNFRLPDGRGRGIIGAGTGSGLSPRTLGQTGGEETHVLTEAEMPVHNHGVSDPGHTHPMPQSLWNRVAGGTSLVTSPGAVLDQTSTGLVSSPSTTGITTQNDGSGTAHNNMHPYGVFIWMIKF